MRKKSDDNFEALNLLIQNKLYASSVHCAYYSCFQLSKYILKEFDGIDYETQNKECKGCDSHNYIISKISDSLERISHLAFLDYNKYIAQLKKMRRKADYTDIIISESNAITNLKSAQELRKLLTNKYSIK